MTETSRVQALLSRQNNEIDVLKARIEALEKALRKLDDMIYELDAGDLDLYEVGDFIDAALGEKKNG